MNVRILRQLAPDALAYWESFEVNAPGDMSIAALLDHISYHDNAIDENGNPMTCIGWECSCLQGVCGSCAMVVNGHPVLACETFIRDLEGDTIEIRPLKKFPVVHDLIVDRAVIQDNLKRANVCIGSYESNDKGSRAKRERSMRHQYEIAKCLKCGLCLEVCPNYTNGDNFFGALFANDCYLVAMRNKSKTSQIKEIYGEHFGRDCSKALSCMDVCPAGISTIASIARLNRRI